MKTHACGLGAASFQPGQISDGTVRHHPDRQPLNVMSKLSTFIEHGVSPEASPVAVDPDLSSTRSTRTCSKA
jgi:Zn-dependent alcohol dehydrogenase